MISTVKVNMYKSDIGGDLHLVTGMDAHEITLQMVSYKRFPILDIPIKSSSLKRAKNGYDLIIRFRNSESVTAK